MVRAGTFESSTVSNSNGLPDEPPFVASAVKTQRVVRGIATRKRVAKVLEKQRKNRGGKKDQAAEQEEKRKEEQR
jgi:hypothetical protein